MFRKLLIGGAAAATLVLTGSGVALAVSDGSYDYERQHCSAHADTAAEQDHVEPGCHSTTLSLYDGSDSDPKATSDAESPHHEYATVGTQQDENYPEGDPNAIDPNRYGGDVTVEDTTQPIGDGSASDRENPPMKPQSGMNVYFGSDDNLDFGEHDNSPQGSGGPSDGGAIAVNIDPANMAWLAAVGSGDPSKLLTYISHNPVPFVNAQIGMGADGHDMTITTNQRTVYEGGCEPTRTDASKGHAHEPGASHVPHEETTCPPPRDAGDYEGMEWDPTTCGGPDDQAVDSETGEDDCQTADHPGWDLGDWHNSRGTTYAEPGIQIYEDPDPQGSPTPEEGWPQPAAAVTTCGVYAGGGPADFSGASDTGATNDAGQLQAENPSCADTNG
jgi:hypothetical protein